MCVLICVCVCGVRVCVKLALIESQHKQYNNLLNGASCKAGGHSLTLQLPLSGPTQLIQTSNQSFVAHRHVRETQREIKQRTLCLCDIIDWCTLKAGITVFVLTKNNYLFRVLASLDLVVDSHKLDIGLMSSLTCRKVICWCLLLVCRHWSPRVIWASNWTVGSSEKLIYVDSSSQLQSPRDHRSRLDHFF